MHVLENDKSRHPFPELVKERRRDAVWLPASLDKLLKLTSCGLRDVEERSERTWSDQRVASPPKNTCGGTLLRKPPQEGGLTDTRLATYEQEFSERPVANARQGIRERGESVGPLEQVACRIK